MNGHIENQTSKLMKTIEEGSIVGDDSITTYPKLSNLPKKVQSNRKLYLFTIFFHQFTNSPNNKSIIHLFTYQIEQLTKKVRVIRKCAGKFNDNF